MDQLYQSVESMFREAREVVIHRGFSETVPADFEDDYFDWLYIDGNHSYQHVLNDLELSFRKVKPRGLITGDDYT